MGHFAYLVPQNDGTTLWESLAYERAQCYYAKAGPFRSIDGAIFAAECLNRAKKPAVTTRRRLLEVKKAHVPAQDRYKCQARTARHGWRQVGGDVNPLEYGGIWQRGSKVLVLQECSCDDGDRWELYHGDLNYSKITDWNANQQRRALECSGYDRMPHKTLEKMEVMADYYGWHEVFGEVGTFKRRRKLLAELEEFGLDVSKWQEPLDLSAVERWKSGDDSRSDRSEIRWITYAYLRVDPDDDDIVQTSKGAEIREWELANKTSEIVDVIEEWIRYVEQEPQTYYPTRSPIIDGYSIDKISEEGVITVGCHKFLAPDLLEFLSDRYGGVSRELWEKIGLRGCCHLATKEETW